MNNSGYLRLAMYLLAVVLAAVVGLIFAIVNLLITQSILGAWGDLVFEYACPIGMIYGVEQGWLPYVHAFIIGLPLTVLAGCTTAALATKQITKAADVILLGGMTGIMSAMLPYGSVWALYALFAIYWVEQPFDIAYIGLVLLGLITFVPMAVLGSYYYSRKKFTGGQMEKTGGTSGETISFQGIMGHHRFPLILILITILTIVVPLPVALACVRLGWIS